MILSEKSSERRNRFCFILVLFCVFAYLAVFAVINIYGFVLFCDSDMYPDTLVARLMWEQKTFFPDGWVFGNQLYIIATPALAALFYGITGSMNASMVLATELMTFFIVASFLWVLRAITNNRLDKWACCLLLIASVIAPNGTYAENAQLFFVYASYYACYLITLFVVYGDYIRSFQSSDLRPVPFGLSLVLCFATGMQSVRQTVVMVLPIICCEIYLLLRHVVFDKNTQLPRKTHILRAISYAAANITGLIAVKWMDVPQISIIGDLSPVQAQSFSSRIATIVDAFLNISGLTFVGNPEYHSFFGFFALVQFLCCIAAAAIYIAQFRKKQNALDICWLLSLVGIIGVSAASLFFNITIRTIYFFLYYPFVAFSGLIILQKLGPTFKQAAILLLCVLSIGNLSRSYSLTMELALENSPSIAGKAFRLAKAYGYPSKSWIMEDKMHARDMCEWAIDEGYEYVYGNWEIIPHIAIPSDGEIVAGYWYPTDNFYHPVGYINIQNIYGAEENEKALYIFTPRDREEGIAAAEQMGVTLSKVAEFGDLYAYTSPIQLMNP